MTTLDENPNCARTYATFRLIGNALNPAEVTAALAAEPTHAVAKGDEITGGLAGGARHQRTGVWLLGTDDVLDSTSLERHLIRLLDAIEPAARALEGLRAQQDLRADFFCYWRSATGNGGPEISPGTLGRIAALNASLGFDFYGP